MFLYSKKSVSREKRDYIRTEITCGEIINGDYCILVPNWLPECMLPMKLKWFRDDTRYIGDISSIKL